MDAKGIADKYISRGGGKPQPDAGDFSRDILTLASFILWHDDRDMHACVHPPEAFAAMCRLLNLEQHRIREIVKPTDDKRGPVK